MIEPGPSRQLWVTCTLTTKPRPFWQPKAGSNRLLLPLLLLLLLPCAVYSTGYLNPERAKPFCQAMIELHLDNQGVPERLHPKSFHSMFMHNTMVWASKDPKVW